MFHSDISIGSFLSSLAMIQIIHETNISPRPYWINLFPRRQTLTQHFKAVQKMDNKEKNKQHKPL